MCGEAEQVHNETSEVSAEDHAKIDGFLNKLQSQMEQKVRMNVMLRALNPEEAAPLDLTAIATEESQKVFDETQQHLNEFAEQRGIPPLVLSDYFDIDVQVPSNG